MAWCPMTPNHYLNQCWLIISGVLRQSPESNFTRIVNKRYPKHTHQNYTFEITTASPRSQWVNQTTLNKDDGVGMSNRQNIPNYDTTHSFARNAGNLSSLALELPLSWSQGSVVDHLELTTHLMNEWGRPYLTKVFNSTANRIEHERIQNNKDSRISD